MNKYINRKIYHQTKIYTGLLDIGLVLITNSFDFENHCILGFIANLKSSLSNAKLGCESHIVIVSTESYLSNKIIFIK